MYEDSVSDRHLDSLFGTKMTKTTVYMLFSSFHLEYCLLVLPLLKDSQRFSSA